MPVQTNYPGVYIEERPSGVHTIVGVSTSVTAFVGAAAMGPVDSPQRVFSVSDYVRVFGPPIDDAQPMGHAVQHFFANGGSQAIVVRVLGAGALAAAATLKETLPAGTDVLKLTAIGKGKWANWNGSVGVYAAADRAGTANPDDLFNLVVTYVTLDPKSNAPVQSAQEAYLNLSMSPKHPRYALNVVGASKLVVPSLPAPLTSAVKGTSVGAAAVANPLTIKASAKTLRISVDFGPAVDIVLFPADTTDVSKTPAQIATELSSALSNAGLTATASQAAGKLTITSDNAGMDSAVTVAPAPSGDLSKDLTLGRAWGGVETSGSAALRPATTPPASTPPPAVSTQALTGGSDGSPVGPNDVVPPADTGIYSLNSLLFPRFNLLCLPDLTSDDDAQVGGAIAYAKGERAFLVVDSPKAGFASIPPSLGSLPALGEHGAVYYPRLEAVEALAGGTTRTLNLPACGAVAGVMARIDAARGIWKAPAGREAGIVGVSNLTQSTDDNVSGLLNPKGVNVLRAFPGAGIVVWGARTLKGDDTASSEFKYIPVRRLTDYIASSLYLGTQFAVFEPNDPDLWAQLRLAVGTFMRGLFRQGAFQQSAKRTESDSFFVVCDETVNPQSEIDLGRVNVVVGFAPLKPAEFVVITITQISQLEG
jgi:Bacteriophage tail sheath protein